MEHYVIHRPPFEPNTFISSNHFPFHMIIDREKFPPPFEGAKVCIGGGAGFIGYLIPKLLCAVLAESFGIGAPRFRGIHTNFFPLVVSMMTANC